MDLDALAAFHLVATHGGFGRAARASHRPKATLSRRVADLERQIGLRLFDRGGASLRLTQEGRWLLAGTQSPLEEVAAAESTLLGGGAEPRGRLRVSVPLLIGSQVMGEVAARFLDRHPKVRLEVVAEDRNVDLVQEGYDVVIRANPEPDEDLVGRCFLRERLLVVASPKLDRPRPAAGGASALVPAVVRAIGDDGGPWMVHGDEGSFALRPEPVLRLSTLAIRDAVLAGAGVALLPGFIVRDALASGRLVSWGAVSDPSLEIWILHASARSASTKVRAFIDIMLEPFPAGALEGGHSS